MGINEIFQAYVKANNLKVIPNFSLGNTKYIDSTGVESRTREELLGSAEFAGFSDGYQGLQHRYRNPIGELDVGLLDRTTSITTKPVKRSLSDQIRSLFQLSLIRAVHVQATTEKGSELSRRYDKQYQIGMQLSK